MSNAISLKNTLLSLSLALALNFPSFSQSTPLKNIAITQFVEHVAADAVRQGLLEELDQTGLKTGEIIAEILGGKKSTEIEVASPDKVDVLVNRKALETLKISLPADIQQQAHFY